MDSDNTVDDLDTIVFACGTRLLTPTMKCFSLFVRVIHATLAQNYVTLDNKILLVHGDARGVDRWSEIPIQRFFKESYFKEIEIKKFPAQWQDSNGNRDYGAGLKRNIEMGKFLRNAMDSGVFVVAMAFPETKNLEEMDKKRSGTNHMMDVMQSLNIPYIVQPLDIKGESNV